MKDDVTLNEKNKRLQTLNELVNKYALDNNNLKDNYLNELLTKIKLILEDIESSSVPAKRTALSDSGR